MIHVSSPRDVDPQVRNMIRRTGQRPRRPAWWLSQKLHLIVDPITVTFNVRVDIDFAILPAFTLRHWLRRGVPQLAVAARRLAVTARVRFEPRPRCGQLAVQNWQRGDDGAEKKIQENPGKKLH